MPLLKVVTSMVVVKLTIFVFYTYILFWGCCTYCGKKIKENVQKCGSLLYSDCCRNLLLWRAMHSNFCCGI